MSIPCFTNAPGYNVLWVTTGDDLGRQLQQHSYKEVHTSPVRYLGTSSKPWRYPAFYNREIVYVDQTQLAIYDDGRRQNVCGEWSGTFLASNMGGRFNGTTCNFDSDLENEAIARCMNKLGDNKAELGSAIVQAKQAINMIASPSVTLLQAYIAARRGNWPKVASILGWNRRGRKFKHFPDKWLEYQFGWMPLLSDISGAYGLLSERMTETMLLSASSTRKRKHYRSNADDANFTGSFSFEAIAKVRVDASISSERLRAASQLGLADPLSVAWDVLPWTFVLDWFMPVGNVLSAISSQEGLQFVAGSKSIVGKGFQLLSRNPSNPVNHGISQVGMVEVHRLHFMRIPFGDFPVPGLYAVDNPFSTNRAKNALALFLQAL